MTPVVNPISNEKKCRLDKNNISCVRTRILVEHNVRMNVEDLARWQCRTIIWNKMWDKNC